MKKYLIIFILCSFAVTSFAEQEIEDIDALKAEIAQLSKTLEGLNARLQTAEKQIQEQKQNSQKKAVYQNQNPDISVTGMFSYMGTEDKRDERRNDLKLNGSEINFTKAVSPYTKGNLTLGFHDDEAEVEEAFVDITNTLPGKLELRLGRFLAHLGYLNSMHSHDWPVVCMPFSNTYFYSGEHGYSDDGVMLSKNLDFDEHTYAKLSLNVLNGNNSILFNEGQNRVFGGRFVVNKYFNDEYDDIQLGLNYNQGAYDEEGDLYSKLYGVDAMYRHRINQFDKIVLFGEYVRNRREMPEACDLDAYGYYASVMYKFRRNYNYHIGFEYDYSEKPTNNTVGTTARSVYAGWWLTENDRLQIQFRNISDPFKGRDNNEIWLQFIWGMGPHKPHLANF